MLDALLAQGRDYIMISNVDNLGATLDLAILFHVVSKSLEFAMEVTPRTRSDVQGGTLAELGGRARLVELAQVPRAHASRFASLKEFCWWNTNTLWVSIRAVKAAVAANRIAPPVLVHERALRHGGRALELGTAAGAAIEAFDGAVAIAVPRERFLPVKSTADLLAIQSSLFSVVRGALVLNAARVGPPPLIKLGPEFASVKEFLRRIPSPPDLLRCEHLTISGDVTLGEGVAIAGTVVIVAADGARIDVPPGSRLEDNVVTGALRVLAH